MSNHSRPNYDGVRFYSANDLSTGINLKHSEDVIMDYENNLNNSDINYILELYNITLLFQLNIIIDEWDEEYYEKLTNIVKRFPARIGQFFSTIDDTQLILLYQNVCINYITSFWAAFEHYDLHKNISAEIFGEFLKREDVHLRDILTHKKLVNAYNYELSIYMLSEYNCAEIIIEQLLVKREGNDRIYYLPRDLTPEKRITLLEEYINSDSPNPNYIEVIITGKSSKELPITPKLRLLANRKHNAMMVEFFSHNQGFAYGPSIIFKEMTADIEFDNSNPLKPKLSYSSTWISENPDYPTILNNFIYLFEYTDGHYRSTFPAKRTHIGVFEDIFGLKGKNAYTTGMSFNLCDNISLLQMAGYYQQLLQNKIQLESVLGICTGWWD